MVATPVRAAVYLRQSLDLAGDLLAVTRQREDCLKLAQDRGWQVVAEFVDNSTSASDATRARPGYDQLVAAYKAGSFEALICWDLDRLTRQPRQLEDWIDAAAQKGLLLVTANGEADLATDSGRLFARIKASVARAEIERKSARQKRAARQRAELGRFPTNARRSFGYTLDGQVVPDEAGIVRTMFERFAAGDSIRGLRAWLEESGVPTRSGRPWHPMSVRTILTNPRYAARSAYRGTVVGPGNWEQIVDGDLFDLVQARLADPRRRTHVGTDRKHLGSGLFRCLDCDLPVTSWTGKRYHCRQGCFSRSGEAIDAYVTSVILERLARPDLPELLPSPQDDRITELTEEAARLRNRLAAVAEDYDAGRIDGTRYEAATDRARQELAAVESRLAQYGTGSALIRTGNPVEVYQQAPLMLQRAILDTLIVVHLTKVRRGANPFDPATVQITWK